jgi:hypothetical protein
MAVNGFPRWKVIRQQSPLCAGSRNVQDCIDNLFSANACWRCLGVLWLENDVELAPILYLLNQLDSSMS